MNNLEKHLYKFTRVEDGLPEKDEYVICIERKSGELCRDIIVESSTRFKSLYSHWLDLDKLTTKERAVEFAEKAYKEGYEFISVHPKFMKQDREEFINQNKNIL